MTSTIARASIAPPPESTSRYQAGWTRGDGFAVTGGSLLADGPPRADEETYNGFIDALAAHRQADAAPRHDSP